MCEELLCCVFLDYFPLLCDGLHETPPARVTCQKIDSVWMLIVSTCDFSFLLQLFFEDNFVLFLDTVYQTAEYLDYIIIQHLKIRDTINYC